MKYFTNEEITLLPIELDDIGRIQGWINNESITKFMGSRPPVNKLEQEEWLRSVSKDKSKIKLIICPKEKAKIGVVSLFNIDYKNKNAEIDLHNLP